MSAAKTPGDAIREELEKRGWGQAELACIMGRPVGRVNDIIHGRRALSAQVAIELANAFGTDAEIWLERESSYRLALAKARRGEDGLLVSRRARQFEIAPLKEMQRRGWIKTTSDAGELELELCRFFEIDSCDQEPAIAAGFRHGAHPAALTPGQKAWYFRAKQMARALRVDQFDGSRLLVCQKELAKLAAFPQEASKVPGVLSSFGIRFVIVEPLSGSKVDGAAFWLDKQAPAIALSLRFDRLDAFWFSLGHEFSHIKNKDGFSIDSNLAGQDQVPHDRKSAAEKRADKEAAAMLISPEQLESFIRRMAPIYSKERIIQFADKVKTHPGIVVGQLQHRGQIGFHANCDMLTKIRDIVVPSSVTDGWREAVKPRILK